MERELWCKRCSYEILMRDPNFWGGGKRLEEEEEEEEVEEK